MLKGLRSFFETLKKSKQVLLIITIFMTSLTVLKSSSDVADQTSKLYDFFSNFVGFSDKRKGDLLACFELGSLAYSASEKSPQDGTTTDNPRKNEMIVQFLHIGLPKEFADLKYGKVIFDEPPSSVTVISEEIRFTKGADCAVVYERAFWIEWLQSAILKAAQNTSPDKADEDFGDDAPLIVATREHLDSIRPRGILPFVTPRYEPNLALNGYHYLAAIQQYGFALSASFRH